MTVLRVNGTRGVGSEAGCTSYGRHLVYHVKTIGQKSPAAKVNWAARPVKRVPLALRKKKFDSTAQ
jgi:hypothetical protein